MKLRRLGNNENGSILLVFIIVLPFLILIAMYYMQLSLTSLQVARFDEQHTQAQLAADAGADYAVEQFSQNNSWTGTGGDITLHNDGQLKTTYSATISGDSTAKTITVTGKTYFPVSRPTPSRHVTVNISLRPVTSGNFSVISGEGGLFMSNSAKIVGGDVFVNGEISLTNTAQIGLSTSPVNVSVADQICPKPADVTYPRVCNSGEGSQPITITNSGHIYGTVKATNQTSGTGMSGPGLVAGTVAPQPLPTYDRSAQKAAVTNNMTASAASCSNGSVTWPANTKITGDVSISNKCAVTVQGNIWITGSLSVSNTAKMIVADALGTTRPNIMVDGQNGAKFSNSALLVANSSNTGFEIYTFYSKAACNPDCASVTGPSLSDSRSVVTIELSNSASAPMTVFYAYWSQVKISNSGQIGALIGQTIQLSNTGTITFGTSTQTGGQTTWVVNGYRRG
jgi:Tfp pilus assembly protein PilX